MSKPNPVHVLVGLVAAAVAVALVGPTLARLPGAPRMFALVLLGVLSSVGFAACALVSSALWPRPVERARATLTHRPLRCGLLGLLIVLLQIWLCLLAGPARGAVVAAFLVLDLLALAQGLPALVALLGERLGVPSRPGAVAAGSLLFAATGALPVIGWALGLALLLQALGAAVLPGPAPATA